MVITKKSDVKIYDKVTIATIDFAKDKNTLYCRRCITGPEMKIIPFRHTFKEYNRIYSRVINFARSNGCSEVIFGFESTGVYAIPFINYICHRPVKVVQVNPLHTKRAREITDNSPDKSDKKDPRVIADIIELRRFLSVVVPEGVVADLRNLSHARERSHKRLTALYNQLHDLVFMVFPEFLQVFKKLRTATARYMLNNHLMPIKIVALGLEELTILLRRISRGRYGRAQAEALFSAAHVSVGVRQGIRSVEQEIKMLLHLIQEITQQITTLESQLEERLQYITYSKLILSIPGIGPVSAAGLIGEIADLPSFESIDELMKLAGMNLYEISSGRFKGKRRISKRGRPLIRKLLYFLVLHMIRGGGIFHDEYHQYIERNMGHNQAMGALARKLLRIIFTLVHNETEYSADYESLKNRKTA